MYKHLDVTSITFLQREMNRIEKTKQNNLNDTRNRKKIFGNVQVETWSQLKHG